MANRYIELHARTAFSFLRGASRPKELAVAAADADLSAMAVCDRGGVYGTPRFYKEARACGVKPIVGCELAMADGSSLPVLMKSRQGYRNLCRLLTQSQLRSEKGEGRVTWDELPEFAEGMIALTGDEDGPLHQAWRRDGVPGVEREVGGARVQDAQHGHHLLPSLLHHHPYPGVGLDTQLSKSVPDLVGSI